MGCRVIVQMAALFAEPVVWVRYGNEKERAYNKVLDNDPRK